MRLHILGLGITLPLLLLDSALCAQQPPTAPVVITVKDPSGAGIAQARVRVVPDPGGPPARLATDSEGHLALSLKPGGYALFVSMPGFKNATQHFDVTAAGLTSPNAQIVSVALRIGDVGSPQAIYPADSLVLTADLYHAPVALSPADFRALPHITIKVHNGHNNTDESYSGVALSTLLAKVNAPIGKELRGEALANFLIASGSDGYSAVLSLAEADPDFHPGQSSGQVSTQIIVADSRNGQPLGKSGPFQLIVSGDTHPARWVHNLNSISLQIPH